MEFCVGPESWDRKGRSLPNILQVSFLNPQNTSNCESYMRVFKPRSRMISVRLSQEEYDSLCQLSTVTGARSLSDLTREAMRLLLNASVRDQNLVNSPVLVQTQMEILNRRIDELREQLMSPDRGPNQQP